MRICDDHGTRELLLHPGVREGDDQVGEEGGLALLGRAHDMAVAHEV